jgi:CRP-like cAMP-binding protein
VTTTEEVLGALTPVLDFVRLDQHALRTLAERAEVRDYDAGAVVFEKGSPADGLYVVLSGSVGVIDTIRGRPTELAVVGPGDFFGEISLAMHTERTRSVRAREPARVAVIPRTALEELATSIPDLDLELLDAFESRRAGREEASGSGRTGHG